MRLTFRPDSAPRLRRHRPRVAFHAEHRDGLAAENAHADIALLRLAMPCPPTSPRPSRWAANRAQADASRLRLPNPDDDQLHGHPFCQIESVRPQLLVSDCRVVSGFSGAPLLSGRPGDWRVEGITVATVFGQPFRAMIADVVPWPDFAGPYALDAPPSAAPQTSP
jgi:hypothetical protein